MSCSKCRRCQCIVANLPKPKVGTSVKKWDLWVKSRDIYIIRSIHFHNDHLANVRWRTIEILKSLEGQPLKKWDCPPEIGTVGSGAGIFKYRDYC